MQSFKKWLKRKCYFFENAILLKMILFVRKWDYFKLFSIPINCLLSEMHSLRGASKALWMTVG
jgi:hypothetical protein